MRLTATNAPGMPGDTIFAVLARPDVTSGRASVDPQAFCSPVSPSSIDRAGKDRTLTIRYTGVIKMFDRITINSKILHGQPCIRGMRIPIHQILDLIAAGKSFKEIIKDYPYLEIEDITQSVEYAAWLSREESFPLTPINS